MIWSLAIVGGCGILGAYVFGIGLCRAASRADRALEQQASILVQAIPVPPPASNAVEHAEPPWFEAHA